MNLYLIGQRKPNNVKAFQSPLLVRFCHLKAIYMVHLAGGIVPMLASFFLSDTFSLPKCTGWDPYFFYVPVHHWLGRRTHNHMFLMIELIIRWIKGCLASLLNAVVGPSIYHFAVHSTWFFSSIINIITS